MVLDEAYIEFSSVPSKLKWVQKYSNLVVLRTFSKSAGEGLPSACMGGILIISMPFSEPSLGFVHSSGWTPRRIRILPSGYD